MSERGQPRGPEPFCVSSVLTLGRECQDLIESWDTQLELENWRIGVEKKKKKNGSLGVSKSHAFGVRSGVRKCHVPHSRDSASERMRETDTRQLGAGQLSGSVRGAWSSEAMETRSSLSKRFQTSRESERPQPL